MHSKQVPLLHVPVVHASFGSQRTMFQLLLSVHGLRQVVSGRLSSVKSTRRAELGRTHTVAIIINAIVRDLSIVHPDVSCQVWMVGLNPRVNDADRCVAAANGLLVPVTWGLNQVEIVQGVAIGRVGILHRHLVVQGRIRNICTRNAAPLARVQCFMTTSLLSSTW